MDNQYMDMFLDESHEHLQSLNEGLLRLEENMEEIDAVNDILPQRAYPEGHVGDDGLCQDCGAYA